MFQRSSLNGDLDTITPSSGARVAANRFPNSTFVELRNSFHVTAIGDSDRCASRLYIRFLRRLDAGNTRCAETIGDVHLVPRFWRSIRGVRGAHPAEGDQSKARDRRLAAAAAATIADVLARWWVNYDGTSVGLRGGTWSYAGDGPIVFRLEDVRFVPGVPVTGTAKWFLRTGRVRAEVSVQGPRGLTGRVRIGWSARAQLGQAWLRGRVGGRLLRATMLAP
jgi:hypothetical protein